MSRHVVFGTGQIGTHVATQLRASDNYVVVVSRSGWTVPTGARSMSSDLTDAAFAAAAEGADVIYFCLNAPNFTFNRSGVRIPTLAISAWIPERTVVNDEFRATSLLATMRQRFNLGQPLSARDASARSFADIFTLTSPRAQEDWPQVTPRPVPVMPESFIPLDAPLGMLGKSLLRAVLGLAKGLGKTVPDVKREDTITGAQFVAMCHDAAGELFPALRDGAK